MHVCNIAPIQCSHEDIYNASFQILVQLTIGGLSPFQTNEKRALGRSHAELGSVPGARFPHGPPCAVSVVGNWCSAEGKTCSTHDMPGREPRQAALVSGQRPPHPREVAGWGTRAVTLCFVAAGSGARAPREKSPGTGREKSSQKGGGCVCV